MRVFRPFRRAVVTALTAACAAGVGSAVAPSSVAGQAESKPCDLYTDSTSTSHSNSVRLPSGKYNTFFAGGVVAHCRNEGNTLMSDSAEYYDELGLLYLIGHVHYVEPRVTVDAHHGTYFVGDGRLLADTSVFAVMSSGTTMRGPHVDYLRAVPGVRPRAQMTATGRPHIHLVQRDSTTATPDTAGIDADRVYMDGDSLIYASHNVVINRTDLTATSDSAALDQGREFARLLKSPVIVGHDTQHPYTLRGDIIDLYAANHQLTRVLSMRHADAISKDMHLTADTIDMRFEDKVLSHSYAWGTSRAHATTPDRDIIADSIDVIMPQQVLHQVRAIRKAYATSMPDTTHFTSTERDWMKGDTIISYFDTTSARPRRGASAPAPGGGVATAAPAPAPSRTARKAAAVPAAPAAGASGGSLTPAPAASDSQPEVRTVIAQGTARALYQLAARDKAVRRPALNYVRGRVITIQLRHHQVQTVTVIDSAAGVYLEPQSDTAKTDSLRRAKAQADTVPHAKRKKGSKPATPATPAAPAPTTPAAPQGAATTSGGPLADGSTPGSRGRTAVEAATHPTQMPPPPAYPGAPPARDQPSWGMLASVPASPGAAGSGSSPPMRRALAGGPADRWVTR